MQHAEPRWDDMWRLLMPLTLTVTLLMHMLDAKRHAAELSLF